MIRAYMMRRIFGNLNYSFAYNLETAEDREIKSLLSFATKTEGVKRLIIVTNEEERTITKDNLTRLFSFSWLTAEQLFGIMIISNNCSSRRLRICQN
jgi:hypothetical protein